MQSPEELLGLIVKTFRRERPRIQQSERTTIHGADGMLMVLQLAMAEINKRQCGEFMVALSDILLAWKHLLSHKLQLPYPCAVPLENYSLILEEYQSFLKCSNTVDLVDIYSICKGLRADSDQDFFLNSTQLFEFLSGNAKATQIEDSTFPCTPSSTQRSHSSQITSSVRRVFCSYLSLLVNSKNDMAMAHILNVPKRNLGRDAFTSIKHAARDNNTSLFLAVTSFVRAIQLGGKGYAPAESNPLRKHVKGLSDIVHFVDNLEEILGEIPDPSVCGARLVSAIRALLVKGRSSGDPVCIAVDTTAKELKERIFQLHENQKQIANENITGISPARPKAYAINHATAIGGRDTVKILMALLDEEAAVPPCQNKADLLSEDQPILNGEESISVLTLYRSPEVSTGCSPVSLTNRVRSRLELCKPKVKDDVIRSQFACTYNDELPLNRVLEFSSNSQMPTCVHPAAKPKWIPAEEETCLTVDTVFSANSASESLNKESGGLQQGAAHGPRSGNAPNRGAGAGNKKKAGTDIQIKANKRKQTDPPGASENEPLKKKPAANVKNPDKAISKTTKKKKLIAGQGKLTNFFRL